MEVRKIKNLQVALLSDEDICDKLTRRNAEVFHSADTYSVPVLNGVVGEFEEALKHELGITGNEKRQVEKSLNRGSIDFVVKATPTCNPSYQSIGIRIEQYLTDISDLNEEGRRREGVRTIEGEAYILHEDITSKMDEFVDMYSNPGVRTTIKYSKMRKDADLGRVLDIVPGTYGRVTGENAKTYRIAKEQVKAQRKQVINPFKQALKLETGYNAENVPDETQVDLFEVGKYLFMVTSSPRTEVKYGEAAKGFIHMVEEPDGFARTRDGNIYLPVSDLVSSYNGLIQDNTRTIVQQDIKTMPQPKYDLVHRV